MSGGIYLPVVKWKTTLTKGTMGNGPERKVGLSSHYM